jgi:hypothetical protein
MSMHPTPTEVPRALHRLLVFAAVIALTTGVATGNKSRLPSLSNVSGEWVGLDVGGEVCRLALVRDGDSGLITCDHHGRLTTQMIDGVAFDRFHVVIDLREGGAYDETQLKGRFGSTSLEMEFVPSRKRITFFRSEQITASLRRTQEQLETVLKHAESSKQM